MQIEIWKEEEVDPMVRLRLESCSYGPQVVAVDSEGHGRSCGSLLEFHPEGILLVPGVHPDLGFPLDEHGRLKVIGR